jgi:Recombination directionality factor-like
VCRTDSPGSPAQEASSNAVRHIRPAPSEKELAGLATNTVDTAADLIGCFSYTTLIRNRPRTLTTWRVTATDTGTARRIAQLLGGHPLRNPRDNGAEVITASTAVDVLLDPHMLSIRWQSIGQQTCDGAVRSNGQSCACPRNLAQRRAAAKHGEGCKPGVSICFRLRSDPALGIFGLLSEDWSFAETVIDTGAALQRMAQLPTTARLDLLRTQHTLPSGRALAYTHPALTLLGSTAASANVGSRVPAAASDKASVPVLVMRR